MNKGRGRFLALLLVLILICPPARVRAEAETMTELQDRYGAMDALNRLRTGLGLRTLSMDGALNEAAGAHSAYMDSHRSLSSLERQQEPGFTGVTPIDRMYYTGFSGQSAYELTAYRTEDYETMLEEALHDPYRRYMLLYPGCDSIGFGRRGDYSDVLLGCGDDLSWKDTLALYPYPGQQEVGNCFLRQLSEPPSEVREASIRSQIGEPVTVTYYSAGNASVEFRELKVTFTDTKRGREVGFFSILPQDHPKLPNTLMIYPLEPYNADTRYEITLSAQVYREDEWIADIEQKWSYTSSGPDSIGEVSRWEALMALAEAFQVPAEPLTEEPAEVFRDYAYDAEDPASCQIYWMLEKGVLRKQSDGSALEAEEGITREQMAIWMMRLLRVCDAGLYYAERLDYSDTFEDINRCSAEGKTAVQRAYLLGLVQDQGGGKFSPDAYITRTEFDEWLTALSGLLETAEEEAENKE